MSEPADINGIYKELGQLVADMRTIKHEVANISQKIDPIAAFAVTQAEHGRKLEDHEGRIIVLETDKHRREGAIGLVEWLSKHWPFTLLVAASIALWAFATGKVSP